jgi:hypothetical protein
MEQSAGDLKKNNKIRPAKSQKQAAKEMKDWPVSYNNKTRRAKARKMLLMPSNYASC